MDSLKKNRTFSFIVILIAYLLAATAGIAAFGILGSITELWIRLLGCDCIATLVIYAFSLIYGNASVYDPYWSVQPMIIVPLIAAITGNINTYTMIITVLIEIWGLRLTANWAYLFRNLTSQDWRYTNLKKSSGRFYPLVNLTGIHMIPTLIVFFCLLPVIGLSQKDISGFGALSLIGAAISAAGIALEIIADTQKHKYRKSGGSGIVDFGIWKKHRHPNYIGEIIFWWGIYFIVLAASPELWLTGIGALLNTLLFTFISIPMAEKQTGLRHPDEWEEYKAHSFYF